MRLSRLPLRARLVVGFVGAMIVVLVGAGAFVWWRVQFALDHRLDQDLVTQTSDLRDAAAHAPPAAAIASLRDEGRLGQLLAADGKVLASGISIADAGPLLTPEQTRQAMRGELRTGHGYLFSPRGRHRRILAVPVDGPGPAVVAASAVRLDQRDEALRELLAQLAIANLLALALASFVGYRLARAALNPVERYRAQAQRIAQGATGVRLDVPAEPADEINRLGSTLNAMLDAQERAAERQQQFIDDASHELRTPLTTLSLEIEYALRKPRSAEEYEEALRRMAESSGELVGLAEALLALGALGSATPNARELVLADALQTAAIRARKQTERAVGVQVADGLTAHADASLLDRALGNLVDNAVRYGGGAITLSAAAVDGATVIAVHDEGAGMAPEFLPHAAERFRQDESSRSGQGAGLGLSLVDAIATAHGGQLRICSAGHHHQQPVAHAELTAISCRHPESGTTMSLLLPTGDGHSP